MAYHSYLQGGKRYIRKCPEEDLRLDEGKSQAKVQIQGNTCSIGTEEYNLAAGDRRAYSDKEFLALRIDPSRLSTIATGRRNLEPRIMMKAIAL